MVWVSITYVGTYDPLGQFWIQCCSAAFLCVDAPGGAAVHFRSKSHLRGTCGHIVQYLMLKTQRVSEKILPGLSVYYTATLTL